MPPYLSLSLPTFLSAFLIPLCIPTFLSAFLFVIVHVILLCVSNSSLPFYLPLCLSTFLSAFLPFFLHPYLPLSFSIFLSASLPSSLSACLPAIYPSVAVSLYSSSIPVIRRLAVALIKSVRWRPTSEV